MKKAQTKTIVKTQDNSVIIPAKIDVRINRRFTEGSCKAIASATLFGNFAVRNLRLVEGSKGMFLSFPSYKDRQGEYYDVCFPTSAQLRQELTDAVVEAYQQEQEQEQSQEVPSEESDSPQQAAMAMKM